MKEKKLNGTIDGDGDQSDTSMMSVDGQNQSTIVKEEVTPKRNAQRTAKGKVKKYGSGDDDDDADDDDGIIRGMESEDNESDYMGSDSETEKKIRKGSTKPKKVTKPKSGTNFFIETDEHTTTLNYCCCLEPSTKSSPAAKKKVCSSLFLSDAEKTFIFFVTLLLVTSKETCSESIRK